MAIDSFQTIIVTNYDVLTITTTVISYYANFACEGCVD